MCTCFQLYLMRSVLKDIVVLVNENTICCNEYLNTLMKLGEIVRRQTKTVAVSVVIEDAGSRIQSPAQPLLQVFE